MTRPHATAPLIAALVLALGGCDEGIPGFDLLPCTDMGECFDALREDGQTPDRPDLAPDVAPPDAALDAAPDMAAPPDAAPDMLVPDMAPMPDMAPGPVESCDRIGSVECFGHPDCPAEQRCEDVGPEGLPVPCCVPGERGVIPAGDSCAGVDGQIECASGVCIEDVGGDDVCSGACEGPADCPPSLPRCVAFPFGGTDFQWCFPP